MPYLQRTIGDTNVSAQGLGCMGMSFDYTSFGGFDDTESSQVLTRAVDLGITFWDTSDIYGPYTNEKLLGKRFKDTGRRNEIFLATKFVHSIKKRAGDCQRRCGIRQASLCSVIGEALRGLYRSVLLAQS